jgi:hypothetical protein
MGKMTNDALRKQIEEILEEYNNFNASYQPVLFPSLEEMTKINEIILKTKTFIIAYFKGTPYNEHIEYYGNRKDKSGLDMVISVLTVLNENLNKQQTVIKKPQSTLKFDKIIEESNVTDNTYEEVIAEINGTYKDNYFTSMYIMVRKMLENLIYDCLKAFYRTHDIEKYFDTNNYKHQGYGTLIDNFNQMIKETRFKTDVGDIGQQFIDLLKEFQEKGNRNAHSLFNLPHQDFIEERRDKINNLIKKLDWVLQKL